MRRLPYTRGIDERVFYVAKIRLFLKITAKSEPKNMFFLPPPLLIHFLLVLNFLLPYLFNFQNIGSDTLIRRLDGSKPPPVFSLRNSCGRILV